MKCSSIGTNMNFGAKLSPALKEGISSQLQKKYGQMRTDNYINLLEGRLSKYPDVQIQSIVPNPRTGGSILYLLSAM